MTLVAGGVSVVWFLLVARPAPVYLIVNDIIPAVDQTLGVLLGWIPARAGCTRAAALALLPWEVVAGIFAVVLILAAIPPAVYLAWRRRAYAPMAVAIVVAAAYPLSLAPRLAPNGVAISGRSSEYLYAGVACVVGLLIVGFAWRRHSDVDPPERRPALGGWRRTIVATGLLTVLFVGNVTIGTAFYERLPESSRPTGYPWSVQADVVSASNWAREHLGSDMPFGASAVDSLALATYGAQRTIAQDDVWPIFFAGRMDDAVVRQIRETGVRYLLVDWRMTKGVPPTPGYYISPLEPGAGDTRNPSRQVPCQSSSRTPAPDWSTSLHSLAIFDLSGILAGSCHPHPIKDDGIAMGPG